MSGSTPLHISISKLDIEAINFLLVKGADVNCLDSFCRTPLLFAVAEIEDKIPESTICDILRLLISHGALVNYRDSNGWTALMWAAERGFAETAKMLVHHGALLVYNAYGDDLLHLATNMGSSDLFNYFIQLGVDPFELPYTGESAFFSALRSETMIKTILQSRILAYTPPNYQNLLGGAIRVRDHYLLMHLHRSFGRAQAADQLDSRSFWVESPLCTAARLASIESVIILLDLGANIEAEGCEHGTVLMAAATYGRLEIVKLLVYRGAKVYTNSEGLSRNAVFAAKSHPKIQHWLLVERYVDQFKLTVDAESPHTPLRPWCGIKGGFEYKLVGREKRFWGEAGFDFLKRVTKLKKELLGTVVREWCGQG